jgi:hypothetical protein
MQKPVTGIELSVSGIDKLIHERTRMGVLDKWSNYKATCQKQDKK